MALLDASLSFIYRNDPFRTVVRSFEYPDHSSFLDTFKRCISPGQAAALCRAIKDPSHGYTWSDYLEHRAKYAGTMRTRVQILPFIPDDGDGSPLAWVVLFDDVTDENKRFLRTMFSSLLEASKLKDRDTGRHIERVNRYSHLLASAMYGDARWPEVDVDFVDNIGFLAAMHDVGKIGTPDDILNKQGPLNEFEWSIMKEHTINGAFILSSYPNPMAKQIAQSHHEWWNGTGYPYRLVGDMIPLPARIVALADVYDALRMRRSYKETFDHKRATLLITADGGTHFDPELVDLFKEMHEDFERIYNDIKDA
ncbi:MAG: HD-GYP domain-containing protein [Spirochaetales bacterium]|nr:HD-GYP domain-containing protein [Spirochaetales bacterium]MBP7262852.1 HD-GYP domain-containing protein [Spirochaetia bacterium]